jgi:hypothetical protein
MTAFKYLVAVLSTFLLVLPTRAQTTRAKSPLADNAALKYYQAFDLLPRSTPATAGLWNADWNTCPINPDFIKLIEESGNALKLLHRGAKIAPCDWGFDYEDGPGLVLPNVQRSRELTRFACLRARYRFENGLHNDGVDDILATLALAHHVGHKAPLISLLVNIALEAVAFDTAARQLPSIDAKALNRLVAGLDKLPPGGTFRDAMLADKELGLVWFKKQLSGEENPAGVFMRLGVAVDLGGKNPIKLLEELAPFYEEAGKLSSLTPDEAAVKILDLKKSVDANPFGKLLFPAVQKVHDADCRGRTRRQLFRAAIAVVQGGKEKLKDYPDPYGKGPFEYVELPVGFELKSKYVSVGQVTNIIVGVPNKK